MKEFPYKTSFSCLIKPLVSEAKDKYLALASLDKIKSFLPNIDINSNSDLLPIAFNATVVGRVNKNDDVIDTNTALAIYKNFIYKQINIEHKRSNVVGVILTAGFSEFGTDKPLTEEEVKTKKDPFNITLGGVIWRVVNNELADFVEDSNDPTSDNYMGISASWELGFTDYKIISLPEGQKNIETGEILASGEDVNKFKEHLRALGGDGLVDGKRVYRMPIGEVLPLGIGLTEKPAADVKGVATNKNTQSLSAEEIVTRLEQIDNKFSKSTQELAEAVTNLGNKQNSISQSDISDVKKEREFMTLKSINDITDENLKEVKASVITDLIKSTLTEKSKEWEQEKGKLDADLSKASEDYQKLTEEHSKLQESLKQLQATVEAYQKEKREREEIEKFNERMTSIAELFEFDDEARPAILEEVKSLATDEAFDKWMTKAKVLYKGFAKKAKAEVKKCADCGKEHEGSCEHKESKASVVENAIDNGTKEKENIPNSSTAAKKSVLEQYASAFARDAFEIKLGKR